MKKIVWMRNAAMLPVVLLATAGPTAGASTERDAGRALIETVLQSGLEALQPDRGSQGSLPRGALPSAEEDWPPQQQERQAPPLRRALDSLGVGTWREEAEEEMAAFVGKLVDKATASIVKRLDRDGEIRARLQQNMQSVEILSWGVVIYLFCISVLLLFMMKRLLASNRRMREQLVRMEARLDALAQTK